MPAEMLLLKIYTGVMALNCILHHPTSAAHFFLTDLLQQSISLYYLERGEL